MGNDCSPNGLEFYWQGDRLMASCVAAYQNDPAMADLITRSFRGNNQREGTPDRHEWLSLTPYQMFSKSVDRSDLAQIWRFYLSQPFFVDVLLFWYSFVDDIEGCTSTSLQRFCRLCILLHSRFPKRPDLLYGLFSDPRMSHLHANSLAPRLRPEMLYAQPDPLLQYSNQLWVKGLYENLHLDYVAFQLYGRSVPASDFHLRILTILGETERLNNIFTNLYLRFRDSIPPSSLSNLLFISLGQAQLDQSHVSSLVASLRAAFPPEFAPSTSTKLTLTVTEKPLVVVVSADLRQHPVGRFWKPLVPALSRRFRLVHVFLSGTDGDGITDAIKSQSFDWLRVSHAEQPELVTKLTSLSPHLAIDLGGHTADNQHGWLHYRVAPVQATYLGFYGPTYARECDWWIIDRYLSSYIFNSYPGSESQWVCDFPSLCYDITAHEVPELDIYSTSHTGSTVIGSYNHTRKLSGETIQRFGALLKFIPDATLILRSFSFYDPAVRRWFLQKLVDAGASPSQLLALPFAPTASDAMADFTRIHLHLDSYPVSGTTTTLDALVMGVPVLTQPTNLYAGAITASLLEAAGLPEGIAKSESELLPKARLLLQKYKDPRARSGLSRMIRAGSLCDVETMPLLFASELSKMIKVAFA